MATVKKSYVIDTMEKEGCAFWRVEEPGGKFIGQNDTIEEVEEGIDLLEDCLGNIEDGRITIMISNRKKADKANGGRGYKNYTYMVRLNPSESRSEGIGGINGTVITLLEKLNETQRRLDIKDKEWEIKELNRKFDELKSDKDKPDAMMEGLNVLKQYLTHANGRAAASVSGADDGPVNVDAATRTRNIKRAIERLAAIDPNIDKTLTILADFAEKNKDQYFTSINMVKSMVV